LPKFFEQEGWSTGRQYRKVGCREWSLSTWPR